MTGEFALFDNFIKKILESFPASHNQNQYFSFEGLKIINCDSFFIFFKELAQTVPKKSCTLLIPRIEEAMKLSLNNQSNIEQFKYLFVLILIFKYTLDSYTGNDDILNSFQHPIILSCFEDINKIENVQIQQFFRKNYRVLIGSASSKSPSLMGSFLKEFGNRFSHKLIQKKTESSFEALAFAVASIENLESLLKFVNSSKISKRYYNTIIDLIYIGFNNLIQLNPQSYIAFLEKGENISEAQRFYQKLNKWATIDVTLPVKTILYMLQPKNMVSSVFRESEVFKLFCNLSSFNDASQAQCLKAILIPICTASCTGCNCQLFKSFLEPIQNILIEFAKSNINKFSQFPQETQIILHTRFPVELFLYSPHLFAEYISKIYKNEDDLFSHLPDVVNRICIITSSKTENYKDSYPELFKPINTFILKYNNSSSIHKIVTGFTENTYFFRLYIFENQKAFLKLLEMALESKINPTLFNLIYHEQFLSYELDCDFWSVTKNILESLVALLTKNITNSIPINSNLSTFTISILNFLRKKILSLENFSFSNSTLESILWNAESILYLTLSFNKSWARNNAKRITKSLCSMIFSPNINIDVPKDSFRAFFLLIQSADSDIYQSFSKVFKICPLQYFITKTITINSKFTLLSSSDSMRYQSQGMIFSSTALYRKFEVLICSLCKSLNNFGHQRKLHLVQSNNDSLSEIKACIHIIFPILRSAPSHFNEIFLTILSDNESIARQCRSAIAESLSPVLYLNIFNIIEERFSKYISSNGEIIKDSFFNSTVDNSLTLMQTLLETKQWIKDASYSTLFSSLLKSSVLFCSEIKNSNSYQLCCSFILSLFKLINNVNEFKAENENDSPISPQNESESQYKIQIDQTSIHLAGKSIINWINQCKIPDEKPIIKHCYKTLKYILNELNFYDCIDTKPTTAEAFENFLVYYSQIQDTISNINQQSIFMEQALELLEPIMKNNFELCINYTISLSYHSKTQVRAQYIQALSSSLNSPAYKRFINPSIKVTLYDLLFENNFELMKILALSVPYNKASEIASSIIEASALKRNEIEVFEEMAKVEIGNNSDQTRNTLFRGNSVPSRAVSYFPKFFAKSWAEELINPLANGDKTDIKAVWFILMSQIESMFTKIPSRLKRAVQILYSLLEKESTDIAMMQVCGFLFLRFICPMIANIEGLVDVSKLLMNASIKPTINETRAQFSMMKDQVSDAYSKIQEIIRNIVLSDPIELKPYEEDPEMKKVEIDHEKIALKLSGSLWSQMTLIETKLHETPDEMPLHGTLDKLITKLKKSGKPTRVLNSVSLETIQDHGESLQVSLDPRLEKWFYPSPKEGKDGSIVFMMAMCQLRNPFTAQLLFSHVLASILSIGYSKYSIVVEFADFDIVLLPQPKQFVKFIRFISDEVKGNLVQIYVTRVQNNALKYLSKASSLLKPLPIKFVNNLKLINDTIGDFPLSESTKEFYTQPDFTAPLLGKLSDYSISLHQKSIQIIGKGEINQMSFKTSNVILLSSIESIGLSQTSKSMSTFTIYHKNGDSISLSSSELLQLHQSVTRLFDRFKASKVTKNTLFADRTSLNSLLIIISFCNMLNDKSGQDLKASSLSLFNSVIQASELHVKTQRKFFSKEEIPYSMLQMVDILADDLAKSNPKEVHNFFFEFSKSIPFFDSKDYANAERYIQPWIQYSSEEIILNKTTLNNLAEIITKTPKRCFMEFNRNIWQNFSRIDLLNALLDKLFISNENSFGSIFVFIAVKYSTQVTEFLIEKLLDYATLQTQRQFYQIAIILNSLILANLFDEEYKPKLLYLLSIIRLCGIESILNSSYLILKALSHGTPIDADVFSVTNALRGFTNCGDTFSSLTIGDEICDQSIDYRPFLERTSKLAIQYSQFKSHKLLEFFEKDINNDIEIVKKLNGILFTIILTNDNQKAFSMIQSLNLDFSARSIATIGMSLSCIPFNIKSLTKFFYFSIVTLLQVEQTTALDLLLNILKTKTEENEAALKISNLPIDLDCEENANIKQEILEIEQHVDLPLSKRPLFSLLLILFAFYSLEKYDIAPIIKQLFENGERDQILSLFMLHFELMPETDIFINIEDDSDILAPIAVFLYSKHPTNHLKNFILKMLEEKIECFSSFDFPSFLMSKTQLFTFIETRILISLAKIKKETASKFKAYSIINHVFTGTQISCLTNDQVHKFMELVFSKN